MPTESSTPRHGRTVYAHIEQSLERAQAEIIVATERILRPGRLPKKTRIALWRKLAGVVSDVESIRLWLEGGAPK